jgi:beta-N-acetylhexosaminidase
MQKAFITGVAGEALTDDERRLLAEHPPAGLILFSRNCAARDQIRGLIADVKAAVGSDRMLVLIDQEGGRVQRLRPPHARLLPPAAAYLAHHAGDLDAARRAAFRVARLAAEDLRSFDIDTSCTPVLDVPVSGAHDVIGNRAYGTDPGIVAALGRAVADGLMAGGVLAVMKHIPGHGRASADSHLELPVVAADVATLEVTDFAPFRALASLPAAMTAHVLFTALDPHEPASTSTSITHDIIRGAIGFDGLLMSDDLSMRALAGSLAERTRRVIAAGSDLALHCNGDLAEMREVATAAPALDGPALRRFERAVSVTRRPQQSYDRSAAVAICERLLSSVA